MLSRRARHRALVAALVLALPSLALASSLGLGAPEPGAGPPSGFIAQNLPWLQAILSEINRAQQDFYRALTGALKAMRENPLALTGLIGLSFAYGVFHAAGPGHGKAVISAYMIANEVELKRGVLISFLSAFAQGVSAVVLVAAGFLVLHGTAVTMTDATRWLELVSFAAITGFGLLLLWRKLFGRGHAHDHAHAPALVPAGAAMAFSADPPIERHDHHHGHNHGHHHHHAHAPGEVCETCGHAHAPTPALVAGERFGLSDAWTAIIAVGLRPCTGALIVLTFSFLNGLWLGGILSVIAMSIGTAITVSVLATIAVTAKGLAVKLARSDSAALAIGRVIEIAGAVAVTLFGLTLLMAALQA